MAATDVSICSNALLMLGAQPINSLDDDNDRARLASNLYDEVIGKLLRQHPWTCCIKRVSLAPDSEGPAFDYQYAYSLPADFVMARGVGELGAEVEFKVEGRKLLCDVNPCLLRYTWRNTNPATWDDMLKHLATLAMSAAMAYGITQSATLKQAQQAEFELELKRAKAIDGQDDTPETIGDFRLLRARYARTDILSQ